MYLRLAAVSVLRFGSRNNVLLSTVEKVNSIIYAHTPDVTSPKIAWTKGIIIKFHQPYMRLGNWFV